jgi:hypothetical protein
MGFGGPFRHFSRLVLGWDREQSSLCLLYRWPISRYPIVASIKLYTHALLSPPFAVGGLTPGWKLVTDSFRTIIFHVANEKAQHVLRRVQFFFFWVFWGARICFFGFFCCYLCVPQDVPNSMGICIPLCFDQSWTFIYINHKGAKGKHAFLLGLANISKKNCDETINMAP